MWQSVIYLRSRARRPVSFGVHYGLCDPQRHFPVSWCEGCGAEVFRKGMRICYRCARAKGEKRYEGKEQ